MVAISIVYIIVYMYMNEKIQSETIILLYYESYYIHDVLDNVIW